MISVSEEILDEMVQVIVREIDPDQVYLFGSRARGDACTDSDVDLLIVDHKPFGPGHSRFQESNRVYQALSSFHVPKDILLYSSRNLPSGVIRSTMLLADATGKEAPVCATSDMPVC